MGGSLLVQLPALIAIIAVGVAALPQRKDRPNTKRAAESGDEIGRPASD